MHSDRTKVLVIVGLVLGFLLTGVVLGAINDGSPVSDGVTISSPDKTTVTINGDTEIDLENAFPQSDTVQVATTAGNITFSSAGQANATIAASDITGTYTIAKNLKVANNDLTINPEDKPPVTVGKQIDRIAWRANMQLDDGDTDFIYAGTSGESKVVINDIRPDETIKAVDKDTNALLDAAVSNSNGVAVFNSLTNSDHTVLLQESKGGPSIDDTSLDPDGETFTTENITLSASVSDPDFPTDNLTLKWYVDGNKQTTITASSNGTYSTTVGPIADGQHDWYLTATDSTDVTARSDTKSFTIDHYDPKITNVGPRGDLDANPTEISAQINDSDFGLDGDSIDVDIYLDGSFEKTTTISSNQTVSTSMPSDGQLGGEHTIEIEATDSYGQTVTSVTTYRVPDQLYVRNETNYGELLSVDGEVRFFQGDSVEGDEVFQRSSANGIINMTGLPVDENFIATIQPTNRNYTQRTIFIDSIYEQENAYLLNKSQYDTVESRFILNDPTGRFDSESVLKIQKPIEINGTLIYQTIVGERFGVEGVTAILQQDTRHQLRVSSEQFEQTVGPYRARLGETVEVRPGTSAIDLDTDSQTWAAGAAISNTTIEYLYSDPQQETDKLVVFVHERGNESNQPVANSTYTDIGAASGQVSVPANQADREWVVEFVVDRNGTSFTKTVQLSNRKSLTPPISSSWTNIIAIGMLVLLAGAFSVLNAAIGAVIVSLFGALLYFIGFLGTATSGIAVAIAIFISAVGHILSSSGR